MTDTFNCYNHWLPTGETAWSPYLDTLEAHGATVYRVGGDDDEDWAMLPEMDMLFLTEPYYIYSPAKESLMIEFVSQGGKIILWWCSERFPLIGNSLLSNSGWETTTLILDSFAVAIWGSVSLYETYRFPPFSNGVDRGGQFGPTLISCGDNCYPYFILNSQPIGVISYPFLHEDNCSSYVLVFTGTQGWAYGTSTMWPDDYAMTSNMLLTAAGAPGYELPPCAVPEPYKIKTEVPCSCASPGDTVTLRGENLWKGPNENLGGDIEIYLGDTVIIPIVYSDSMPSDSVLDSTWLKFICPALPEGTYTLELGHKAITFPGGELKIPCEEPDTTEPDTTEPDTTQHDTTEGDADKECLAHPKPFTPNGDGINDNVKFEYPGIGTTVATVDIYTLDNELVVELEGSGIIRWDGRDSEGRMMGNGIYLYLLETDGQVICSGTVYLAR